MDAKWADLEAPSKEENVARWLLTFTDLVALLVCFFVLLFSMKELDQDAWDSVRGSFDGVFAMVLDEERNPPTEAPQDDQVAPKKGSVLPYLQQVLRLKLAENGTAWEGWQGRYDREHDELWYPWPFGGGEGGDVRRPQDLARALQGWRNAVFVVRGGGEKTAVGVEDVVDKLRADGATVVRGITYVPAGVAEGVWIVVKGNQ
ncbi:MAG: hypothetical protein COY40_02535 [Alphaproteobacteria bacterium CG_4_10_14_0_8_um_filter_53_9]|nr:MAG: hypothetical protein COY40_02535 [Alphaproteobacteria bacterium CG_4_10_14_0_8_um_filter_53_9]